MKILGIIFLHVETMLRIDSIQKRMKKLSARATFIFFAISLKSRIYL